MTFREMTIRDLEKEATRLASSTSPSFIIALIRFGKIQRELGKREEAAYWRDQPLPGEYVAGSREIY